MMLNTALLSPLFSDSDVAAIFSDAQYIAQMLKVEVALAKVQAELGIIPPPAAAKIAHAAAEFQADMARLQTAIDYAGVPVAELAQQLRGAVNASDESYVHWGATTQDIMDTALVLQIRAALEYIEAYLQRVVAHLARLADQHRKTLMAGRTHTQQALPISFGLKAAGWLAPLLRHKARLAQLKPRLLVVQLGGAAGTLASLGEQGLQVQAALARELELGLLPLPWHTQRDGLVEFAGWLSLVTGSLAKMAQDILLMTQSEIAEVRESNDPARGGSSSMPQKANPVASEVIVAAARTNAALLSALHQALIQEHERATGSWQIEWLTLPQMVILTAAALKKAAFLSEHLVINSDKMRQNVAASNGLTLAEALDLALAPHIGRAEAKRLIKAAGQTATAENRHLVDVVREKTDAPIDWESLRDEANYLGSADHFIDRVLAAVKNTQGEL